MPRKTKQELANDATVKRVNALARAAKQKSTTPKKSATLLEGPNLHKTSGGWNKKFAYDASMEFASRITATMSVEEALKLMTQYVAIAGWKNPAKALAAKFGLTNYTLKE